MPRWQTACRTSASRRSSGRTTAARCLSSVDGDVPGPYPGEDRSSRSRGSNYQGGETATQAPVKRPTAGSNPAPGAPCPHRLAGQGRRPLKAETRVRIPVGTLAPASAGWTARLLNEPAQVRILPGAHAPAVRLERTPRYERGDRRFESSRGYEGASVVQQENAGPTCRRRGCNSLRAYHNDCSRKHLARLPGRLPGEAGSIPVGGAHAWVAQLGRGRALRPHAVRVRIPPQVRTTNNNKQKGGEP